MLAMPLPRSDFPAAFRALGALLRDPDDLPQVFTMIEALSGTAPHRILLGFRRTAEGRRLLREQPDIVRRLSDRPGLRALPEGSLGRAYLAFVESEGISAEGIRDASERGRRSDRVPFEFIHRRMRDTHDLWHAATGYKGDLLGELGLLGFSLAQTWNSAIAMILVGAVLKGRAHGAAAMIREGYRRGRSATWLASQDWEALLPLPLDEVRARLGLGAPPVYTPVRTEELRAEGAL